MTAKSEATRPARRVAGWPLLVAVLALALVASGPLAAQPVLAAVALGALIAATISFVHPPAAAYLLVATGPLLAGMDRGALVPVLRPSEAVAVLLGGTILARGLLRGLGQGRTGRLKTAEASIVFLALAGSVVPVLAMLARGRSLSQLDVFYALVFWKCLGVYVVFRNTVRTEAQVRRCLMTAMVAGVVVAVVGVLQALGILGVPGMVARYFAPEGYASVNAATWGTSTVGQAQAMGDVMAFNMGIALAWLARGLPHRKVVMACIPLFALGTITSAEFSSAIGLVIAVVTASALTGTLRKSFAALVPVLLLAGLLLQPVVKSRLHEFSTPAGIPPSWSGRIHNIQTYVLPPIEHDYNWVLGVRPAAEVTKSTDPPRYGYIESGYLWLLWTGGIPLLIAFVVFMKSNLRITRRLARAADARGVAAVASFTALVVVAVLSLLDPHLTFRGAGELDFALLALAHTALGRQPSTQESPPPTVGSSVGAVTGA